MTNNVRVEKKRLRPDDDKERSVKKQKELPSQTVEQFTMKHANELFNILLQCRARSQCSNVRYLEKFRQFNAVISMVAWKKAEWDEDIRLNNRPDETIRNTIAHYGFKQEDILPAEFKQIKKKCIILFNFVSEQILSGCTEDQIEDKAKQLPDLDEEEVELTKNKATEAPDVVTEVQPEQSTQVETQVEIAGPCM